MEKKGMSDLECQLPKSRHTMTTKRLILYVYTKVSSEIVLKNMQDIVNTGTHEKYALILNNMETVNGEEHVDIGIQWRIEEII